MPLGGRRIRAPSPNKSDLVYAWYSDLDRHLFALEKWKDIGYSYNRSRTMVSQVSVVEDQLSHPNQHQRRGKSHYDW